VRDGVLHVVARTSTWASELTFHKHSILKGINQRLGKGTLRDLRFRQGRVEHGTAPGEEEEPWPSPEELATVALTEADGREIAAGVAAQPDADLRDLMERILTGECRRRHWLEQHGERVCPACGSLYRRPGKVCPACRRELRSE
jgi:predicted nucleic acid-binding Zn ribbon protein